MLALSGFGCVIDSMIAIPGAIDRAEDGAACHAGDGTIQILLNPAVPAGVPGPESFVRSGDCVTYAARSTGWYDCLAGSITITPVVGASEAAIASLLVANALPTTLWLRGAFMLHAAVLRWPGEAAGGQVGGLAICGPSGSGKSMLARQWVDHGAALVADDVLALGAHGDMTRGAGLPAGLHLPPGDDGARVFRQVPASQAWAETELDAILILERRPAGEAMRIGRLTGSAAVEALLQNRHRPIVPALMRRQGAVLAQAMALAANVPVWRWARPEGAVVMRDVERDAVLAACGGDHYGATMVATGLGRKRDA